jgi:hypothetical protein
VQQEPFRYSGRDDKKEQKAARMRMHAQAMTVMNLHLAKMKRGEIEGFTVTVGKWTISISETSQAVATLKSAKEGTLYPTLKMPERGVDEVDKDAPTFLCLYCRIEYDMNYMSLVAGVCKDCFVGYN